MTSEHLLEAMGLIDDTLLQDAQSSPVKRVLHWQRWASLAACVVLVCSVGYALSQMGARESATSGAMNGLVGNGALSCTDSDQKEAAGSVSPEGAPPFYTDGTNGAMLVKTVIYSPTGEGVYTVADKTVQALPANCVPMGTLIAITYANEDSASFATEAAEYVGEPLWLDEQSDMVYIELTKSESPEYLMAVLVEDLERKP